MGIALGSAPKTGQLVADEDLHRVWVRASPLQLGDEPLPEGVVAPRHPHLRTDTGPLPAVNHVPLPAFPLALSPYF